MQFISEILTLFSQLKSYVFSSADIFNFWKAIFFLGENGRKKKSKTGWAATPPRPVLLALLPAKKDQLNIMNGIRNTLPVAKIKMKLTKLNLT